MCGRFTLTTSGEELAEAFGLDQAPALAPRFNIAPTQPVLVLRREAPHAPARAATLRWGLVPPLAREPGRPLINARAETAAALPSFRDAFRRRRCLVPADGFYEWRKTAGPRKQPMLIRLRDGRPFAFAGLWEPRGRPGDAGGSGSCAILTTVPNTLVAGIHDRMPVILPLQDFERWLDPGLLAPEALTPLLRPFPAEMMEAFPVADRVNDARYDGPDCAQPLLV
jgi:putative SOS response-associated peptidase YedK